MEQLEKIIERVAGLTSLEVRQIRFKYPQKGLIQALRKIKGDEAGDKILQAVAKECTVDVLPGEQIQIHKDLISAAANEISRLGFALKALPLKISAAAQGEVLILAMTDPTCAHTKSIFKGLFNKPIKPVLVREDELLEALRFQIPSGTRGARILRPTDFPQGEAEHVSGAIKDLFTKVIDTNARELHFEILGANVIAHIVQGKDRKTSIDCNLTPDELLSALIVRSRIDKRDGEAFSGIGHLAILPTGIDFFFQYEPEFKSDTGEKGRKVVVGNFQVKTEKEPIFWNIQSQKSIEEFAQALETTPGLYLAAFPNLDHKTVVLSALQRLYPDLHIVKEIQELSQDPDTTKRLAYTRVVLPISSTGISRLTKSLEKAPEALRGLVKGIFSYCELERPCIMCLESQSASPKTLSFVPQGLHSRLQNLKYSRGCPICRNTGYLGETSVFSFASTANSFGEALRSGKPATESVPHLRKDGWSPITEISLEQALNGDTTIEQVAAKLLGGQVENLLPTTASFDPSATPLEQSRLWRSDAKPQSQVEFHSVVIQAGGDLMAAREALLAEQSAGEVLGTHEQPAPKQSSENAPVSSNSASHAFHSVVLDLDDDMSSMRDKLLAEYDDD